ncbi:MAG: hypothetical protein A2W31_15225 [Planctomycetes bacterium RBG_16_64_10]|nr:MAG: hypothetical protein A2W31_15225 [Planctomycetes bacterium RBG_16_64_10]
MATTDAILQTLVDRVGEMRDALAALEAKLAERCPYHSRRLDRIETILDGPATNGLNPGLMSRVRTVEDSLGRLDSVRVWAVGVAGIAIGGLIVAIVERML